MNALPLLSSAALTLRAPEQLLLPDILSADPLIGLFYVIYPDPVAAASLARLAHRLRDKFGLRGRPLATDRFHATLHHFDHYYGLRMDYVELACEAAAKISVPSFRVVFDRVMCFRRSPGDWTLVMRGDNRLTALKNLRQELGVALKKTSLGRKVKKQFTPHVTLLYDHQEVGELEVEPVSWTVSEFALVQSLIGQTKHIPLGRWPLRGS